MRVSGFSVRSSPGLRPSFSRFSLLAAVLLALGGCSGDECEEADDNLEECDTFDGAHGYTLLPLSIDGECSSGTEECMAECVNEASCAALRFVLVTGSASDPNDSPPADAAALENCLTRCAD